MKTDENPNNVTLVPAFDAREYMGLRIKEGWVYPDPIVKQLPNVSEADVHYKEWQIRKESKQKLLYYLQLDTKGQDILELGCGNGWLSNAIARIPGTQVVGMDVNKEELAQAERVFQRQNLRFIHGDIFSYQKSDFSFDKIIVAAAIQYFSDFSAIVTKLLDLLKEGGELHILDSPFYSEKEMISAQKRTETYYMEMGHQAMIPCYHHHQWKDLERFDYRILKSSWLRYVYDKMNGMANPFPWIIIKNKEV